MQYPLVVQEKSTKGGWPCCLSEIGGGDGSRMEVQVALNPPLPTALSAVMKERRSISPVEMNSAVSLDTPPPHNSMAGEESSFQTRTTAEGHPRSEKKVTN